MKISWFRPSFIDRKVAVAASIFSGVALATTIEFAVNGGQTQTTKPAQWGCKSKRCKARLVRSGGASVALPTTRPKSSR